MTKKSFLQLFLFFILFLTSLIFFKIYFEKDSALVIIKDDVNKDDLKDQSNLVHNIKYTSKDINGNSYILESKLGKLNDNQPELVLMSDVKAIIEVSNSKQIVIYSDNAEYNKSTNNTNFYTNVAIEFNNQYINSDYLDFIFNENLVTISKNIIYKNMDTTLEADKIEINLLTKNTKIFMDDKLKKVKLVRSN
jgi:lipopolysaccharide assembly outer membrane protein LptD (OstA)